MISLQNLISNSNKQISSLQNIFYKEAEDIFNNKILKIGNIEIELTEVEFYFYEQQHLDPYVHKNNLQRTTSNYLYVHQQAWNRGGIDITFGDGIYYGGILIRGIKHNNCYISGSATVKKYISNLINPLFSNHGDLQRYFFNIQQSAFLKNSNLPKNKVLCSTRVGLNQNNPSYANALYRFIREDCLNVDKSHFSGNNYDNLKERTKIKAISNLALNYPTNEKSAIEDIKKNLALIENIKLFKQ